MTHAKNKLPFTKMHGLGNDFMVVDATQTPFTLSQQMIALLSHRKTGVGFDQLLVVETAKNPSADFDYRIFNADGSEVEHCGNGARCFAKFVIDQKLTDKKSLCVDIKKGQITIHYQDDNHIEVDMGKPITTPAEIPFIPDDIGNGNQNDKPDHTASHNQGIEYQLMIDGSPLPVSILSMGNPHAVLFVTNLWQQSIESLAQVIQQSPYFPESVNVNYIEILDNHTVTQRTYERGVGETDACGTGVCAGVYAAHSVNAIDANKTPICVKVRGGELKIRIADNGHIYMAGPARTVYHGVIDLTTLT